MLRKKLFLSLLVSLPFMAFAISNSQLVSQHASDFSKDTMQFDGQGVSQTLTAGASAQNIDYCLTSDEYLTGGKALVLNPNFGDNVSLQVVDKNNVLGFGAGAVLNQFITSWFIQSDKQDQFNLDLAYPARMQTGLCIRVIYNSTGVIAPKLAVNWYLHRPKY